MLASEIGPIPPTPELSESKSSKSSSFHSIHSDDDGSILADATHFEEIGLEDDMQDHEIYSMRSPPSSTIAKFPPSTTPTARPQSAGRKNTISRPQSSRSHHTGIAHRELTNSRLREAARIMGPERGASKEIHPHGGLMPSPMSKRGFVSPSTPSLMGQRHRSPSPSLSPSAARMSSQGPNVGRRGSWNSTRERKTAMELEKECDELDDGDDVPDECFLENVPISPRPPMERIRSQPPSAATSPERPAKEKKVRPAGNGTPAVAPAQGTLRSPRTSRPGTATTERAMTMGQFPMNLPSPKTARAKSWTAALSELSAETKALTEALEDYAEEEDNSLSRNPNARRSFTVPPRSQAGKARVKSSMAELPPLRRTDIMIDPLPISKEKEAVLSRTRPSWLPPKNPLEEKRHLKEYQRMMALSAEADRKREEKRRAKENCRDDTANSLLRIWEEHVIPNWDAVTKQKRTRELWWRGISPRSRGAVWQRAIGNELALSEQGYAAALKRAKDLEACIAAGKATEAEMAGANFERIRKDVDVTYPELRIFQPGGPLHESLVDVLMAYAMYRSDVGYIAGTNTIAALLLLNLPTPADSFITLSNILNRPLPLSFHTHDHGAQSRVYDLTFTTLATKNPHLHTHLVSLASNSSNAVRIQPHEYLYDIYASLFTNVLDLDNATRLWDVFVFEGDAVLVRAAVALLSEMEGKLFGAGDRGAVLEAVSEGVANVKGAVESAVIVKEDEWMKAVREAGKDRG